MSIEYKVLDGTDGTAPRGRAARMPDAGCRALGGVGVPEWHSPAAEAAHAQGKPSAVKIWKNVPHISAYFRLVRLFPHKKIIFLRTKCALFHLTSPLPSILHPRTKKGAGFACVWECPTNFGGASRGKNAVQAVPSNLVAGIRRWVNLF